MNCLAIDTTNTKLTVVLLKDDKIYHREIEVGKSGHSRLLMPTVDEVLEEADADISAVEAVAAVVGPGSFTGIRIGVSAMTAIAFANNAKRISVTSFEVISYNCANVLAAVDAGHGNLYCAECENGEVKSARFISDGENNIPSLAMTKPVCDNWLALAGVVRKKLENGCFQDILSPFYMRKSQAEREKDEI